MEKLTKKYGLITAICMVVGTVIGSGVFFKAQNVLAVTIPTVLKCNFSTTLGLRTCNAQQSRFLIASTGCEMLPDPKREGKGYGFIRDGADLEKLFIYKYADDVVADVIRWWTSSQCIAV